MFYAALMQPATDSTAQLHAQLYEAIQREVPAPAIDLLLNGSHYRRTLRASPEIFALQLPFYTAKPLYIWLGGALTRVGTSSVVAPYIISAASLLLLGLAIALLAIRLGAQPAHAFLLGSLFIWMPEAQELGTLATPDALATTLSVLAAACSLSSLPLCTLLLSLASLARPDAALIGLAILVVVYVQQTTGGRKQVLVAAALLACTTWLSLSLTGAYAWSTVVRHTFLNRLLDEAALGRGLSTRAYLKALKLGLGGAGTDHPAHALYFLTLAAFVFVLPRLRTFGAARGEPSLLVAVWAASLARLLVMPLVADRFFGTAYAVTLASACSLLNPEHWPLRARSAPSSAST